MFTNTITGCGLEALAILATELTKAGAAFRVHLGDEGDRFPSTCLWTIEITGY
jgi:hypothetical protein